MEKHKQWVRDIFDRAAPGYGEKACTYFDYFGQKLVDQVPLAKGNRILDAATGKGAVLLPAFAKIGPLGKAVGIDLSLKMIEEAKKRAPSPAIELLQMDAERLDFPSEEFDAVFCAFALFFFPSVETALLEFKRVLKPAGTAAMTLWGKRPPMETWLIERAKELGAVRSLRPGKLDTPEALKESLEKAGFVRIEIREESKTFWHESPETWWTSLWSHGFRSFLEQLSPENLAKLKEEALNLASKETTLNGFPYHGNVIYGFGKKTFFGGM